MKSTNRTSIGCWSSQVKASWQSSTTRKTVLFTESPHALIWRKTVLNWSRLKHCPCYRFTSIQRPVLAQGLKAVLLYQGLILSIKRIYRTLSFTWSRLSRGRSKNFAIWSTTDSFSWRRKPQRFPANRGMSCFLNSWSKRLLVKCFK